MDLLEKLETYRKNNDLSITEFVRSLGISRTVYYNWLSGLEPKAANFTLKVIEILGDEIYDGEKHSLPPTP